MRFDDMMMHYYMDEDLVITLSKFQSDMYNEYQKELLLKEVHSLVEAYQITLDVECLVPSHLSP